MSAASSFESGPTIADWRRAIVEDTQPRERPVAVVFFTAAGLREYLRTLGDDEAPVPFVFEEGAASPAAAA
jgi:hypothetical protein